MWVILEGLKMDSGKVSAVKQWPYPNDYVMFMPSLDPATFIKGSLKLFPEG
jgi:hypothetical protein